MVTIYTFAIGAVFSLVITLVTMSILKPHLSRLLDQLCGSPERAGFWTVVSSLCLFLVGLLAGTAYEGYPQGASASTPALFFGLVCQVRIGLFGVLGSLIIVAWILLGCIRRLEAGGANGRATLSRAPQ